MDIRHLRVFVAVAEELHFGRAAERLNLSQPPVSIAIKELEEELGLRLFERTSRRIELTDGGSAVLNDARAVLNRLQVLRENARKVSLGRVGSISLGTTTLPTFSFLPDILRRFTLDFPDVQLGLMETTSDQILVGLERGTYDIGFMFTMPVKVPGLSYLPIGREPLILALPEDHPAARLARVPLEMLASDKFLVFERQAGPLMFDSMVALCMRHGFSPKIFTARLMPTIISLVSAGIGVALLPICFQSLRREGVVYRPLAGESSLVESGAAWRTDDTSLVVGAFLRYLPEGLKPLASDTGDA
ncbi:LysR family transcriptional regulator [Denitromonas ohlonensis]|uniref:LysR family transcriptional regulator n=2 Tax=Denitromonas TaxID=139331 RepID=A0A557RNY6_9RHOO|nr:LysR family transcriptional regulator [Denitromonas ohlonensis]TVO66890.1 LysR family transcriptional regulator [Denitromonas ohlonensis]TVO79760.1 LysR family transcriptional regulator [Denitromonas ohlonensis]